MMMRLRTCPSFSSGPEDRSGKHSLAELANLVVPLPLLNNAFLNNSRISYSLTSAYPSTIQFADLSHLDEKPRPLAMLVEKVLD
jgi:hypothetical protein